LGLELGEDFYEDCNLFESTVVPHNLPALLYAATTSKRPFSLAKGPDILEFVVTSDLITVVASDSEMVNKIEGYPDFTTGDQGVTAVRLYLNIHPDDYKETSFSWDMNPVEMDSGLQTFELELSFEQGVPPGRHILYAQAMDGNGYLGPVSSVFVTVESPPTKVPTKQVRPSAW
jgi:hypothetical protein